MKSWVLAVVLLGTVCMAAAYPDKLRALDNSAEDDDDYIEEPKRPYSFSWTASRYYNGAPDREHKEQRGEDGITRGVYRYTDPSRTIQEVVYYADEDGFHVESSNLPQDTVAVQAARSRHQELFDRIQEEHARIAEERALLESNEKLDTIEVYQ